MYLDRSGREAGELLIVGPLGTEAKGLPFLDVGPWDGTERGAGAVTVEAIRAAVSLGKEGRIHAIVTGPAHKPALHAAGFDFPGQTELLQDLTGTRTVGMLMCAEKTDLGPPLRVLLATTHLPLRDLFGVMSLDLLLDQMHLLDGELRRGWGIDTPRIGLCAMNPHASDGGLFGDEEERILEPTVKRARAEGLDVAGPIPADTVFRRTINGEFDAAIAPYHDVGMAAFKTVCFGGGVNTTLGLPLPRTSPDHGTAFDLAGTGKANPTSTLEAIELAARLARSRFDRARTPR